MLKQWSLSGEQTAYLVRDKVAGAKANLQGQYIQPQLRSREGSREGSFSSEAWPTLSAYDMASPKRCFWPSAGLDILSRRLCSWLVWNKPKQLRSQLQIPKSMPRRAGLYEYESNSAIYVRTKHQWPLCAAWKKKEDRHFPMLLVQNQKPPENKQGCSLWVLGKDSGCKASLWWKNPWTDHFSVTPVVSEMKKQMPKVLFQQHRCT